MNRLTPVPERSPVDTVAYAVLHPRTWHHIPRWLGELRGSPLELRRPWWTYEATEFVKTTLPRPSRVFEYGSGGSTLWLIDQGANITSVEHDEGWFQQLSLSCVSFVPATAEGKLESNGEKGTRTFFDDYVAAIDTVADDSLDLAVIDGRCRVECAKRAASKVRAGGMLLFDDFHRSRYNRATAYFTGWRRYDFLGLRPGSRALMQTTVWVRPPQESHDVTPADFRMRADR